MTIFKNTTVFDKCALYNQVKTPQPCKISNENGLFTKRYSSIEIDFWEAIVATHLKDSGADIVMPYYIEDERIVYKYDCNISLRAMLKMSLKNGTIKSVINEIASFVYSFKTIGFTHGNLHIDNLFMNPKTFKCCVMDLGNAYISGTMGTGTHEPLHRRESLNGDISNVLDIIDMMMIQLEISQFLAECKQFKLVDYTSKVFNIFK
jgi:serine/threonine protein kinase